MLEERRDAAPLYNVLHYPIYISIAAAGAGLHVVSYLLDAEHAGFEVTIGPVGTVLSVVLPVAIFVALAFGVYALLLRTDGRHDGFHLGLLVGTLLVAAAGVLVVALGAPVMVGILVASFAPVFSIVGYEWRGHQHMESEVEQLSS